MTTMRKSRYVTLLLAGAAATALAGCDQNVMTGGGEDATLYGDPAACAKEMDATECTKAFDVAKEEHVKSAPKFNSQAECEAAGYTQCEIAQVRSADGSSSTGMFMPMMMGYMMGRTLGGGMGGGIFGGGAGRGAAAPAGGTASPASAPAAAATRARPVYSDRNGYLYANGGSAVGRVAPGTTSLGSSGVAMRTTSRGGFGASAGRFSAGS